MAGNVTIHVNIDDRRIQDKLNHALSDSTFKLAVHNLLAKMCDPFVPFLEGPLSQTLEITPDFVRYVQPYAHYQYYGTEFNHTLEHHPLASAKWDEAMMQVRGDEFIKQVKQLLSRKLK